MHGLRCSHHIRTTTAPIWIGRGSAAAAIVVTCLAIFHALVDGHSSPCLAIRALPYQSVAIASALPNAIRCDAEYSRCKCKCDANAIRWSDPALSVDLSLPGWTGGLAEKDLSAAIIGKFLYDLIGFATMAIHTGWWAPSAKQFARQKAKKTVRNMEGSKTRFAQHPSIHLSTPPITTQSARSSSCRGALL